MLSDLSGTKKSTSFVIRTALEIILASNGKYFVLPGTRLLEVRLAVPYKNIPPRKENTMWFHYSPI